MSNKLPRAVPLPEVAEYTDNVVFGNLGLPVGFDEQKLVVNLRAFESVRRIAGLGTVSLVGTTGEAGQVDVGVQGVNHHGVATMGAARKRPKKPLAQTNIHFPDNSFLDKPQVAIFLNNAEITERIHEQQHNFRRGVFDERARAKFLNGAIRTGLLHANREANVDTGKWVASGVKYTLSFLSASLIFDIPPRGAAAASLILAPLVGLQTDLFADLRRKVGPETVFYKDWGLHRRRKSLFLGATPDRMIAANTLTLTSRFISHSS